MKKLFIIKAERCDKGRCWQYTRQDVCGFVDAEDIRFLKEPSRQITRKNESPLENQDYYYANKEEYVPEEANTIIWTDKTPTPSNIVYSVSYANLKLHPYIMNSATREAIERGKESTFNLSHIVDRAVRETIKDTKKTGRIK